MKKLLPLAAIVGVLNASSLADTNAVTNSVLSSNNATQIEDLFSYVPEGKTIPPSNHAIKFRDPKTILYPNLISTNHPFSRSPLIYEGAARIRDARIHFDATANWKLPKWLDMKSDYSGVIGKEIDFEFDFEDDDFTVYDVPMVQFVKDVESDIKGESDFVDRASTELSAQLNQTGNNIISNARDNLTPVYLQFGEIVNGELIPAATNLSNQAQNNFSGTYDSLRPLAEQFLGILNNLSSDDLQNIDSTTLNQFFPLYLQLNSIVDGELMPATTNFIAEGEAALTPAFNSLEDLLNSSLIPALENTFDNANAEANLLVSNLQNGDFSGSSSVLPQGMTFQKLGNILNFLNKQATIQVTPNSVFYGINESAEGFGMINSLSTTEYFVSPDDLIIHNNGNSYYTDARGSVFMTAKAGWGESGTVEDILNNPVLAPYANYLPESVREQISPIDLYYLDLAASAGYQFEVEDNIIDWNRFYYDDCFVGARQSLKSIRKGHDIYGASANVSLKDLAANAELRHEKFEEETEIDQEIIYVGKNFFEENARSTITFGFKTDRTTTKSDLEVNGAKYSASLENGFIKEDLEGHSTMTFKEHTTPVGGASTSIKFGDLLLLQGSISDFDHNYGVALNAEHLVARISKNDSEVFLKLFGNNNKPHFNRYLTDITAQEIEHLGSDLRGETLEKLYRSISGGYVHGQYSESRATLGGVISLKDSYLSAGVIFNDLGMGWTTALKIWKVGVDYKEFNYEADDFHAQDRTCGITLYGKENSMWLRAYFTGIFKDDFNNAYLEFGGIF